MTTKPPDMPDYAKKALGDMADNARRHRNRATKEAAKRQAWRKRALAAEEAVNAVRRIHRPESGTGYADGVDVCAGCSSPPDRVWVPWPCPTSVAVGERRPGEKPPEGAWTCRRCGTWEVTAEPAPNCPECGTPYNPPSPDSPCDWPGCPRAAVNDGLCVIHKHMADDTSVDGGCL